LDAIIRIRELSFTWPGSRRPCLSQLALDVNRGERLFVHGESGAGKSTLLNLIGGVMLPERGYIDVLGRPLGKLSSSNRDRFRGDHTGFIFQQFNLIPYLSVLDNVLLPCRFSTERARRTGGSASAEARRLLAALDLDPRLAHRPAASLSVGQQQRVSAARALIGRPELILADEPTSALDPRRQAVFIELLMGEVTANGGTLVFVSHDQRLAPLFDRCIELLAP
jgi:putative ABC transport system ATP-binding protein